MALTGVVALGKFLLTLAVASILVLLFSMFFGPMFAIMALGPVRDILIFIFPKGLLLLIFFVALARFYMDLQGIEAGTHIDIQGPRIGGTTNYVGWSPKGWNNRNKGGFQ